MKIQKFRPPALFLLLIAICLVPVAASAQTSITGIKIKSSGFDPATRIVKLKFIINDTPTNITAWGYCVRAQNAPGQTVSHSFVPSSIHLLLSFGTRSNRKKGRSYRSLSVTDAG